MEDLKLKISTMYKNIIEENEEERIFRKEVEFKKFPKENFKGLSSKKAENILKKSGENSISTVKNISIVKI